MSMKTFVIFGYVDAELVSWIELKNNNAGWGRLILDGQIVMNGVTGLTADGASINVPASAMLEGKHILELQISTDGITFETWATGILKVSVPRAAGGSTTIVMPDNYPLPASQYNSLSASLNTIANNTSGGMQAVFPDNYPLPTAQHTALIPQTDGLTNAELRDLPVDTVITHTVRTLPVKTIPVPINITTAVTDSLLASPPNGQRIRLIKNAGHVDPNADPGVFPIVTVKLGNTVIYKDKLEAGLPWSESVCFEGDYGDNLYITVDVASNIYINMRYELF